MTYDGRPLDAIETALRRAVSGGVLPLSGEIIADSGFVAFLRALPGKKLAVNAPVITLSGKGWPAVLTVSGKAREAWPVSAYGPDAFAVDSVTVTISRADATAPALVGFQAVGKVRAGTVTLPVTASLTDSGELACVLTDGDHGPLSLPALVEQVSNSGARIDLPADLPFADLVKLTELDLIVGFGATARTEMRVAVGSDLDWPLVGDEIVLRSVGAGLAISRTVSAEGYISSSFRGALSASLRIGADFDVVLGFGGGRPWEIALLPADGALPTLPQLAAFAGGQPLQDLVQGGLDALDLEEMELDAVRIGFDPVTAPTLRYVRIAAHLIFAGVRLDLSVRLMPGFAFGGSLRPPSTIGLRALFTHFFGNADGFPDITITQLGLTADPSAGTYELVVTAEDDDLTIGPIGLRGLHIDIAKDTTGFHGTIGADIELGGATLIITAGRPAAAGPWVFSGSTGPGQQISIATLHSDLEAKFGSFTLPPAVQGLTIDNLDIEFDTAGSFSFACHLMFPVGADTTVDLTLLLDVRKDGTGPATVTARGTLLVGDLRFDVDFARNDGGTALLAAYTAQPGQQALRLKDLFAPLLAGSPGAAAMIPDSLTLQIKDVFVHLDRPATPGAGATVLAALDLGAAIDLTQLPLIGRELPAGQTLTVDDLRVVIASAPVGTARLAVLNGMLPPGIAPLPTTDPLTAGVTFAAVLSLGGEKQPLTLPTSAGSGTGTVKAAAVTGPTAAPDSTKWITVQRSFGPLRLGRVGFAYTGGSLWFLLDAGIALGGLAFSLNGLAVGSPLQEFSPTFDLRGLGLDYANGPLSIGGALMRSTLTGTDGVTYDEYEGSLLLKTEQLTLTALGAYAYVSGYPSLFVYAVLDYPIGGPAFLFVTGLAAGFGYNRRLIVPPIDQVAQFPLVSAVTGETTTAPDPLAQLTRLRAAVVPSSGDVFLAAGIRFTSFKQVDTFALLIVLLGGRFEIDVLGLSTMRLPAAPGVPPIAEIQMALKAGFVPDEGYLGVQAQLTSASFLFSRDCHLTGGFAFAVWFSGEHRGDFVATVGGYRPGFRVPAHYPQAPRLGFTWQVSAELSVKGEVYFALMPGALTAGGNLQANWTSGRLAASFSAGVDFLLAWQPYHYEASLYVHFAARYTYQAFGTHTISVDVGADLSLWGPEFAGTARIHLSLISFDIAFGDTRARPAPLDWGAFQQAFLPADTDDAPVGTVTVGDGLMRDGETGVDWVLSPKRFSLVTDSAVPAKTYDLGAGTVIGDPEAPNTALGIGPMDVRAGRFASRTTVRITRDGVDVTGEFGFAPVHKRVPRALWGESVAPSLDGDALLGQALTGFVITPTAPVQPDDDPPRTVTDERARYETVEVPGGYRWQDPVVWQEDKTQDPAAAFGRTAARTALLEALGVPAEVTVDAGATAAFLVAPVSGRLTGGDR
ncbi:DUF6603 domain-containing protein [Actinoplanes couchii]|uniref:DUF6603 domain-containing protein n=1 Tax=Actinoplanes couchii TaxID=403638 RepID=A0ABQ3X8F5_9ACTN|nr:DUF6603 domain-containing protein [Actinoplanes couchii]MDR6320208.1 hypothetical protein [Actinoplanes couchii]GID54777.1 hypothetical protein Aco03nite_031810 [Actinoplanes couchii]